MFVQSFFAKSLRDACLILLHIQGVQWASSHTEELTSHCPAQKAKPYIINKVKHNGFFSVILHLNEAKVNIVNQILSFQKLYEINCLSHLYRCCCTTFSPVKSRMQQYGCNRGSLSWLVTGWSPAGIWQTKRCVRLQTEGKLSSFRPNQCQRWLKWICLSPWGTTELQWGGGGAAPGASGDTHALPAVRRPCLY